MEDQKIIEHLKQLGINNSEQLNAGDIVYWHLIKFKEYQNNNEELIKLNNALQELESFEEKYFKDILDCKIKPLENKRESDLQNGIFLFDKIPAVYRYKNNVIYIKDPYERAKGFLNNGIAIYKKNTWKARVCFANSLALYESSSALNNHALTGIRSGYFIGESINYLKDAYKLETSEARKKIIKNNIYLYEKKFNWRNFKLLI